MPFGLLPIATVEATGVADASSVSDLVSSITPAVKGVYDIAALGFAFIAGNALCLLMVGISLAGAGLGLVGRAFKTSRR